MSLRNALIAFSVAIGVIGILAVSGLMSGLLNVAHSIVVPIVRPIASLGRFLERPVDPTSNLQDAQNKIHDLEAQVASLSVDYVKLQSLSLENENLKDVAAFLKTSPYDHVGAHVIARDIDETRATLLVDRGAADGLEIGMAGIVGDGVYVGKITSLSSHVARITLVSDQSNRLSAALSGQKQLIGVIEGHGNHVAGLTLVPQSTPLKKNDVIVTAGTEEKIPANLVVGLQAIKNINATYFIPIR